MSNSRSIDLRERVVKAYDAGNVSYEEIAERFDVSRASVNRWLRLKRETGAVAPRAHGGGQPRKLEDKQVEVLRQVVAEKSDATRTEMARALAKKTRVQVSAATIGRELKRLGFTRKKSHYTRPKETRHES